MAVTIENHKRVVLKRIRRIDQEFADVKLEILKVFRARLFNNSFAVVQGKVTLGGGSCL